MTAARRPRAASPLTELFGRASRLAPGAIVAVALLGIPGCGDDGGEGDLAAFCGAVETLQDEDPFAGLDVASPDEMRTAFEDLRAGAEAIASSAPADVSARADDYLESVDALIDELRAAGYDPRAVDALAYRSAAGEYEAAAVSVENAAAAACS